MNIKVFPFFVFLVVVLCAFAVYTLLEVRKPSIRRLDSEEVQVGDTVSIYGSALKSRKGKLFWGGNPVYASSVHKWTDEELQFVVNAAHSSGYFFVRNEYGESNKVLLIIEEDLADQEYMPNLVPVVSALDLSSAFPGDIITVAGRNFFSEQLSVTIPGTQESIRLSHPELELHRRPGDELISFILPGEARSGTIVVANAYGETPAPRLTVRHSSEQSGADESIYLVSQYFALPSTEVASTGYLDTFLSSSAYSSASLFSRSENIEGEGAIVSLEPSQRSYVRDYLVEARKLSFLLGDPTESEGLEGYLDESNSIPLSHEALRALRTSSGELAVRIRRAYDNVVHALEFYESGYRDAIKALEYGQGSAYAYATLLCAVFRSMELPSRVVAGLFIDEQERAMPHYWVEFFYPGTGWVPCDPALEDSAYELSEASRLESYFAAVDNRHLAFRERREVFYTFSPSADLYFSVLRSDSDERSGTSSYALVSAHRP